MLFHFKGGSFCKGPPAPLPGVCLSSIHNYGKVSPQHRAHLLLCLVPLFLGLLKVCAHGPQSVCNFAVIGSFRMEQTCENAANALISPRCSSLLVSGPTAWKQIERTMSFLKAPGPGENLQGLVHSAEQRDRWSRLSLFRAHPRCAALCTLVQVNVAPSHSSCDQMFWKRNAL